MIFVNTFWLYEGLNQIIFLFLLAIGSCCWIFIIKLSLVLKPLLLNASSYWYFDSLKICSLDEFLNSLSLMVVDNYLGWVVGQDIDILKVIIWLFIRSIWSIFYVKCKNECQLNGNCRTEIIVYKYTSLTKNNVKKSLLGFLLIQENEEKLALQSSTIVLIRKL